MFTWIRPKSECSVRKNSVRVQAASHSAHVLSRCRTWPACMINKGERGRRGEGEGKEGK